MNDEATEQATTTAAPPERAPEEVRRQLALALDVDDIIPALRLARELSPWFGTMKVGLELYSAAGPEAITTLVDLGVDVFCSLTLHTAGGPAMVRAGVEGLREGAAGAGLPEPVALGVTVLTSEPDATSHLVLQRVAMGLDGGCQGFVCAVSDITDVHQLAPSSLVVTPGIRPEGAAADDQARVATPRQALDSGAGLLVIGRPVTAADDPVAAARALVASLV